MITRRRCLIMLSLPVWSTGCAIFSKQTYGPGFDLTEEVPEVRFLMSLRSHGILGVFDETFIMVPPLLQMEVARGPYRPELTMEDDSGIARELEIHRATVCLQSGERIESAKSVKKKTETSEENSVIRSATLRLPFLISQHEQLDIVCDARIRFDDGSSRDVHTCHRFFPKSMKFITDWISWSASC